MEFTSNHDPSMDTKGRSARPTYGQRAARGMLWTIGSITIMKLASFGAQLVLGWLLSKDDFAVYAIAISVSSMVTILQDGGVRHVLIQRGSQYDELASPLFKIALIFNCLTAAIVLLSIPFAVSFFDAPQLVGLLTLIAVAIPLSTPAMIYKSKLSIDLRFATTSAISTFSIVLRHSSSILFAFLGLGIYSFVLPLIVVAMFDTIASRFAVGS